MGEALVNIFISILAWIFSIIISIAKFLFGLIVGLFSAGRNAQRQKSIIKITFRDKDRARKDSIAMHGRDAVVDPDEFANQVKVHD